MIFGKNIFFAGLFLCIFSALIFCGENRFEDGSTAYIQGNLDEALILVYEAYQKNPENDKVKNLLREIYVEKAEKFIAAGDYVEASKYLEEAKKLNIGADKISKIQNAVEELINNEDRKALKPKKNEKGISAEQKLSSEKKSQTKEPQKPPTPSASGNNIKKVLEVREKVPQKIKKEIVESESFEKREYFTKVRPDSFYMASVFAAFLFAIFIMAIFVRSRDIKNKERERELFEKRREDEQRLKNKISFLESQTQDMKKNLEEERMQRIKDSRAKIEKKEIQQPIEKKELHAAVETIRKATQEGNDRRQNDFVKRKTPIPIVDFLPSYTDIPISAERLGKMIETAKDSDTKVKLFWGLGNKREMEAVEILTDYLDAAKGSELKEILKSLKKISLRPGVAVEIKNKIESVFVSIRRKGIII